MFQNRVANASRWVALALVALVPLATIGCSKKIRNEFIPNQPPTARFTRAPINTQGHYFYAFTMNWTGFDPDGRVDHYLYKVDPVVDTMRTRLNGFRTYVVDTSWVNTTLNEAFLFFHSDNPDPGSAPRTSSDFHTFALHAVDDKGLLSLRPIYRTFNSFTIAPQAFLDEPRPTTVIGVSVPPTVRMTWHGVDADAQVATGPVKYKFKLFTRHNPDFPEISDFIAYTELHPDSMRVKYAPGFAGWDSTRGDTTTFQYTNLVPDNQYLFVLTAFDEAGAYDPDFDTTRNMLDFTVTFAGQFGPVISMFNDFFSFTYQTGGYLRDESRWFKIEVPADQPVTFNWIAEPPPGASIKRYRWVMDLEDLSDNTARTNEITDTKHWSAYGSQTTSATVGPFSTNQETHLFYIEVEDTNGLKSLGVIYFTVVRSTFEKSLLFVNDTRLFPDNLQLGSQTEVNPLVGPWPTAAELDTFFYATGGKQWKSYPVGTLTVPGLFAGYEFDTTSTRGSTLGLVPLSTLGHYKFVVWYTDPGSAVYVAGPGDNTAPITAMRYSNSPGRPATLSTYMKQGGRVWMMGGGVAFASLAPWNRSGTSASEFTDRDGELVPGRMMYDFTHWRSTISILPTLVAIKGATTVGSSPLDRFAAIGRGWTGQPDYTPLPTRLEAKTPATDPLPPLRDANNYYVSGLPGEAITQPNFIREVPPDSIAEISTLDTLYGAAGGTLPLGAPLMTYYHGYETIPPSELTAGKTAQVVFSGFPIWYFKRPEIIPVVDFVLGTIFGLPRTPVDRGAAALATYSSVRSTVPVARARLPVARVAPRLLRAPKE